jgi:hypothetical protein
MRGSRSPFLGTEPTTQQDLPVAWTGETGRRQGTGAERALIRRWPRPGQELYLPRSHASENLQNEGRTVSRALAETRANEPRESLDSVKKRIQRRRRSNG